MSDAPAALSDALLQRLCARWEEQGAPIAESLNPGLASDEVEARLAAAGLAASEEVRRWWGWHDGAKGAGLARVMVGRHFEFASLDAALAERTDMAAAARDLAAQGGMASPHDDPDFWWHDTWLPLCADWGGTVLVADLAEPEAAFTPVLSISWEELGTGGPPRCESVGQLVTLWLRAFDDGVWRYDRDAGRWEYHWDRVDPRLGVL